MNDWTTKRKTAIVEADDFMDRWDRNGLNLLFYWKALYPKFKITLFTVPDRISQNMINLIGKHADWINLAVHGWNHESNFECYGWNYEKATNILTRAERVGIYQRVFKAPGWTITPGYNGYPAGEKDLILEDTQAVYKALKDKNYIIFDRHYNKAARPPGCKIVCIDDNPNIVHFHTWNVPSGDINGRNGFQDIEENFGVPWDQDTEFYFVYEAWKKELITQCKD